MVIICDNCGAEIECRLYSRMEGETEITFLRCPECGEEYISSVTDQALRRKVAQCGKMAQKVKPLCTIESYILRVLQLHEQNVQRSRFLLASKKGQDGEDTDA